MKNKKDLNTELLLLYIELIRRAGNYTWAEGKKMKGKDIKNELFRFVKERKKDENEK